MKRHMVFGLIAALLLPLLLFVGCGSAETTIPPPSRRSTAARKPK